jgi:hypothetical protein
VPDIDRSIRAYLYGDARYFFVPDEDAKSIGAKFVTQVVWYGSVRTPFTFDPLDEWLRGAGFISVSRRGYGQSAVAGLAALDNRERETLFVEAVK